MAHATFGVRYAMKLASDVLRRTASQTTVYKSLVDSLGDTQSKKITQ
jgi:hypothetical protein